MSPVHANVLLCDEDRAHTELLGTQLAELGHYVTVVRSCAEAFTAACRDDFDALVAAPFVRDGSSFVLPGALGIRRPRLVVVVTRMSERLEQSVARRVGFDAQLTKIVDPARLDRIVRHSVAAALAERAALPAAVVTTGANELRGRAPR